MAPIQGAAMKHYVLLAANLVSSAVVMYLAMFTMIDGLDDFYNNANMAYMTITMVAPMGALMLLTMRSMYKVPKLNAALYVLFAASCIGSFAFTRTQAAIGDVQFLRSMVPHHSGAILMCRESALADTEIVELCRRIIRSQQEEIDQMNRILARL
jgi:uncharacterized protein (DUF305 family)